MYIPLQMEPTTPNPFFNITQPEAKMTEAPSGGYPPEEITASPMNVQTDQEIRVRFRWTQSGIAAAPPFASLPLDFQMGVYFEKWGPGPEKTYEKMAGFKPGNPFTYQEELSIAADALSEGVYKVIAYLKLKNPGGGGGSLMVGFAEIGTVNVYDPADLFV